MNSYLRAGVIAVVSLAAPFAMAASVSFVKKQTDTNNTFQYFYAFTCNGGSKGTLTVVAANDKAAQKLAEAKARNACEEI
jgi:hypothetical protein